EPLTVIVCSEVQHHPVDQVQPRVASVTWELPPDTPSGIDGKSSSNLGALSGTFSGKVSGVNDSGNTFRMT
ncbi:hypothetical protein Tco_0785521, partial [Tanacetum coccineum]